MKSESISSTIARGSQALTTLAVVMSEPEKLALREIELMPPGDTEVVVDVSWSGISTGTERLLWSGKMPPFPGMGYPLVPGYESVGRVTSAGSECSIEEGTQVFVSGASCFGDIRGLFGGAASRLVVSENKVTPILDSLDQRGVLLALAATAVHAIDTFDDLPPPDLIIGHGVLGRLLARITLAKGYPAPTVWEIDPSRTKGADGYEVAHPDHDLKTDYRCVYDVSGSADIINSILPHLAPRGVIVLAGFYSAPVSFNFPPAFMREAQIRVAAEWQPADLTEATALVESGRLSLTGLITHASPAVDAPSAYEVAFTKPDCLKMVLDWRNYS